MKKLLIALFVILPVSGIASAQSPVSLLRQVGQIRLLESNRYDVKRVLSGYDATDDEYHYQEFSNGDFDIEVSYSSGVCSDDADSDEASEIWSVPEWTVTRIEVVPNEAIKLEKIGFDLSKFKRERRYPDNPDSFVFHNKTLGLAFKTTEEGIERIIVFPSRDKSRRLCVRMTAEKGFYTRNGWFSVIKPYDFIGDENGPANVVGLDLDAVEIESNTKSTISVLTTAIDPENDVLTYNYYVTGGQVVGSGAKVAWDLGGVAPGTYSITAGVDDGCGICGRTVTKTVTIK